MRSGSLHVHEPRYKTHDYGANDHQDSLLGGHDLKKFLSHICFPPYGKLDSRFENRVARRLLKRRRKLMHR